MLKKKKNMMQTNAKSINLDGLILIRYIQNKNYKQLHFELLYALIMQSKLR